jgi:hypothetical protein
VTTLGECHRTVLSTTALHIFAYIGQMRSPPAATCHLQCPPCCRLILAFKCSRARSIIDHFKASPQAPPRLFRSTTSRGRPVVTPPHSAGIYYLFGFFLFGIIIASSCSCLRSPSAVPWVCLCECVCAWGGGCVWLVCGLWRRRLSRSRVPSFACMRSPPQQIPGSRAGPCPASVVCVLARQLPCFCFCLCGSRVVSVRSLRVALVSRVCLRLVVTVKP